MIIFTTKLSKTKVILAIVAMALAICALILLIPDRAGVGAGENKTQSIGKTAAQTVRNEEERQAYINGYGWKTADKSIEISEILIPEEFDAVYKNYNEIQKEQGFNLQKYCGQRAMLYTYEVLNYPTGEQGVRLNLLVHNNRVIGGDVCSVRLDGFMHGLDMPE